jgi:hypothetical protein
MAYNNRNKLLQMQAIIELYLKHKTPDRTSSWVYRHIIYPQCHISRSTLYNYLNTPVKKLLREAEEKAAAKKNILTLDLND